MPRGNYWEATFDPTWAEPTNVASLTGLGAATGLNRARIVSADGQPVTVKWKRSDGIPRRFQDCDFQFELKDSYVSNCMFVRCRFKGSVWTHVKFSNCEFEQCDFSYLTVTHCQFLRDCLFRNNSASAEMFRIETTAISASGFLKGLAANLKYLPAGISPAYQASRFVGTKQKIAKAIYSATLNEPDLEYFYQAYEQLVRCTLDEAVERHRFKDSNAIPGLAFVLRSAPARIERRLVLSSGWLTSWGRSVLRAMAFLGTTIVAFALVYALRGHQSGSGDLLTHSLLEATNISLVAGYTAYYDVNALRTDRVIWVLNLILGLYWYSLIIPVLSRRTIR